MSNVKIVTDSTCDLPAELVEELDITVVPLYVIFGEESAKEGEELATEDFYEKLQTSEHHPSTSQPTPEDFVKVYEPLKDQPIVSIHLSAALSGTCESALAAKAKLEDHDITVIDSKLTTIGLGLVVVEAARAAKEGKSAEEIKDVAEKAMKEVGFHFCVDTLEYLAKGGRIGKAQELLGSLLSVKPILFLEDGKVATKGKVRGRKKVFPKLVELMEEGGAKDKKLKVLLAGFQNDDRISAFKSLLEEEFDVEELIISKVGAVIGTHTGPGVVMCSWV